jgi:hypothetical protein
MELLVKASPVSSKYQKHRVSAGATRRGECEASTRPPSTTANKPPLPPGYWQAKRQAASARAARRQDTNGAQRNSTNLVMRVDAHSLFTAN